MPCGLYEHGPFEQRCKCDMLTSLADENKFTNMSLLSMGAVFMFCWEDEYEGGNISHMSVVDLLMNR